jgi:hypothetical protein
MPEIAEAQDWLSEFQDVFSDPKTGRAQVREHKQAAPQWVPVEELPRFPFVSVNQAAYEVVQIDVDDPGCGPDPIIPPVQDIGLYHWLGIPVPNLVVESTPPRFHAFWILERSLPFKATPKSLTLFHHVRQKLNFGVGGDPASNIRGAARCAFYEKATARCFTKERRNLYEIEPPRIQIPPRVYKNKAHQYQTGNRNRCTFEVLLRHFKKRGEKASVEELFDYAVSFQNLCDAEPLPDGENLTIARSVKRNGRRYGVIADRNHGAMGLETPPWDEWTDEQCAAEVRRRRALGAYYASGKRKEQTREWLKAKVQELQLEGRKVTQRAVAEKSGCSTKTVNTHWPHLL